MNQMTWCGGPCEQSLLRRRTICVSSIAADGGGKNVVVGWVVAASKKFLGQGLYINTPFSFLKILRRNMHGSFKTVPS
jgi:hypothetical protein